MIYVTGFRVLLGAPSGPERRHLEITEIPVIWIGACLKVTMVANGPLIEPTAAVRP